MNGSASEAERVESVAAASLAGDTIVPCGGAILADTLPKIMVRPPR